MRLTKDLMMWYKQSNFEYVVYIVLILLTMYEAIIGVFIACRLLDITASKGLEGDTNE